MTYKDYIRLYYHVNRFDYKLANTLMFKDYVGITFVIFSSGNIGMGVDVDSSLYIRLKHERMFAFYVHLYGDLAVTYDI